MTTREICAALDIRPASLYRLQRRGLPFDKAENGRTNIFDLDAVRDWILTNETGKRAIARVAETMPNPTTAAVPASDVQPTAAPLAETDDIETILHRMKQAQRVQYSQWARAVQERAGAGEQRVYQANWLDTVERIRRMEKDLPRILVDRGVFRPIDDVLETVQSIFAVLIAELEQFENLSTQLSNRPADYIRDRIRKAVRRMRERMRDGVADLMAPPTRDPSGKDE
mgnify:FL=1|tara:strand:- start:22 stop:702 length:681 start_codon:yes stop_codon:yes gene_type:complete